MQRHSLTISGYRYWLAQNGDTDALKQAAIEAVRDGGGVIDFVAVGNKTISALVSSGVPVIFEIEEVDVDERDTGDVNHPFDEYDYGLPETF
jgi:hypothetical protein